MSDTTPSSISPAPFTLLIGLLLIFYALAQSAHARHPLNAETVGLMVVGTVILVIFYFIERRAAEPIIPLDLFQIGLYQSSVPRVDALRHGCIRRHYLPAAPSSRRARHNRDAHRHSSCSCSVWAGRSAVCSRDRLLTGRLSLGRRRRHDAVSVGLWCVLRIPIRSLESSPSL